MPQNFPDTWLDQVETTLVTYDDAPWLAGIPEINGDVSAINAGTPGEINTIYLAATDFEVDILVNNNTYPLEVQEYEDGTISLNLVKYQTKQVPLSDDQIIGASYDLIASATGIMTTNIQEEKFLKGTHAIGPAANTADTPVLAATGRTGKYRADGTEIIRMDGTRPRLTYNDVVNYKDKIDKLPKQKRWPKKGRRLALCGTHWNDLLLDRENYGDQLVNYKEGDVAPMVAGFQTYQTYQGPFYNGTNKLPFNTVPVEGQYEASVAFHEKGIAIKTGVTRQYFTPANISAGTQSNVVSYRHYHLCIPKRNRYIGAITSQDVVEP